MHYLWLFLDFSAYSDIAVGLGRLMRIETPENFRMPLTARNLTVFWERWHISLSMWIRRNVYTPINLFLMRRTEGRWALACACVAVAVAFVLCGLWHGLGLRFLAWGTMHGVGLMACMSYRVWLKRRIGRDGLRRYQANRFIRFAATLLTFGYVALSLVIVGTHWGASW